MPRKRISITSQPEIRKLKRGGYAVRYRLPPHDDKPASKSEWRKVPDASKKGEVWEEAVKFKRELENEINDYTTDPEITLGAYARRWQDERKETGEVAMSTWTRDDQKIRSIEECEIAKIPIVEVTAEDIDRFKIEIAEKGWSAYKQRRTLDKLTQVLRFAESRRVIPYDPSRAVKKIKYEAEERKAIPRDVLQQMLYTLDREPKDGKRAAIRIAIGTGFRMGECLGLQWGDLHLTEEHAYISLRRQLNRDGQLVAPKHGETGDIPIDDDTAQWLYDMWYGCFKYQTKYSEEEFNKFPVCRNRKWGYLSHTNFSKWWKTWCVDHGWGSFAEVYKTVDENGHSQIHRVGYEGPLFHSIRHSMGSELVSSGADLKTVQAMMRHKSIRSSEPYLHSIDDNMIAAAAKVGENRQYVEEKRVRYVHQRPIKPEAKKTVHFIEPKPQQKSNQNKRK